MKKQILFILTPMAILIGSYAFVSCGSSEEDSTQTEQAEHTHYACPMDCEKGKTYDKEGTCPVCGMDLEEVES